MGKKSILFIIACAMIVALFSCSGSSSPEEFTAVYSAESIDNNFAGAEFVFITDSSETDPLNMGIDTLFKEMMDQRIGQVANEFNCSIRFYYSTMGAGSYIPSMIAAGMNSGDLYYGTSTSAFSYGGYLYPLTEVSEYVDYTDENKYGTKNLLEYSLANSVPYAVVPVMWPTKIFAANFGPLLVIGEDHIARYGLVDPRDYNEQGRWTLSLLDEVTGDYHIIDGEKDLKAIDGSLDNFSCGIFGAVGMKMIIKKEDGTFTAGYNTEEMVNVINWTNQYCANHKDDINYAGDSRSYIAVAEGKAVMACMASHLSEVSTGIDNFGLIPFPYDDTVIKAGEQNSYYDVFNSLGIVVTSEYPEEDAVLVSSLCEPFSEYYTNWNELMNFLNQTVFFDQRDGIEFINMVRHCVSDYSAYNGYSAFNSSALGAAIITMSGRQAIEKYEHAQDKIIEKYISGNYDFMKDYWGN